jgi:hypothetical protein
MVPAQSCAFVIGMSLMFATASTSAGELELSLESRFGVDTNVFRRPTGPKAEQDPNGTDQAAYFEISPRVEIRDADSDSLDYRVRYKGTRSQYLSYSSVTGWDHEADASGSWRISPVDTLSVGGSYLDRRRRQISLDQVLGADPGSPDELARRAGDRQRTRTSGANTSLTHSFNSRASLTGSYAFNDIDFVPNAGSVTRTVDTRSHTASLSPRWVLDSRTSVGFGVTGRFRDNRGIDNLGQANTDVTTGDFSLQISRQLTKAASLSLNGGPSLIRTETVAPSGLESDELNVSWFAQASFRQKWEKTTLSVDYSRFESASGGQGTSSIVDEVTVGTTTRLARHLSVRAVAIWNQREQLANNSALTGIPESKITQIQLIGSISYQVSEQISLSTRVQYFDQKTNQREDPSSNPELQVFTAFVAFRYTFEPLDF